MLTKEEILKYDRNILIPEIGEEGQEKLKNARLLVIGAGGLGCPSLLYLVAAGIGTIGIVDDDVVEESNLHRQILFDVDDMGKPKALTAKMKLQRLNPLVAINPVQKRMTVENALELIREYDIILDGTDNYSSRYMVSDACWLLNKILVSGSLFKFQGQLSVFNYPVGEGPTYRCLYPSPPAAELSPNCSVIGILGPLPGTIGAMMAAEAIKIITNAGEILSGKCLVADFLTMNFEKFEFEKNPESLKLMPQSEAEFKKMNYDFFCAAKPDGSSIKEISVKGLHELITNKAEFQLLDVRELNEQLDLSELKALKISMADLENGIGQISRNKMVIVACQSGHRSRKAIEILQNKFRYENLFNLTGGLSAWTKHINHTQTEDEQRGKA